MSTIPEKDAKVLVAIFRNGSSFGDSLSELASYCGVSVQRLAAVARKYDGRKFKAGTISYIGPQTGSMKKDAPGIKSGRNGISAPIPAMVFVQRRRVQG